MWRSSHPPTPLLCSLFFFSSRRRHTRYWRDWSSDVCSSDLSGNQEEEVEVNAVGSVAEEDVADGAMAEAVPARGQEACRVGTDGKEGSVPQVRSEERRVGKECRSRRSAYQLKKKSR